jgi:REP element-mobilizing transposase RayT
MALPRMVVPGGTYLVTRTTSDRRFLLKPGLVDDIFLYCLFRAAAEHGVLLHQLTVESTHFHLVCTDVRGTLSEFVTWLNRHVALCLLEHYRTEHPDRTLEGVWARGSFNATLLVNEEAIVDAIVYSVTNPVKDGLVADISKWPGICTSPEAWLEGPTSVRRPDLYFRHDSPERQSVAGRFVVPPQLRRGDPHAVVEAVRERIRAKLNAIRRERSGKSFLGRKALLRQDPFDAPRNQRPSYTRNPTVKASGDGERYRLARNAVRAFREAYRTALRKFRNGVTKALFPSGTLMMRKRFKVRCSADDFFWCCRATTPG